jgi:integrase
LLNFFKQRHKGWTLDKSKSFRFYRYTGLKRIFKGTGESSNVRTPPWVHWRRAIRIPEVRKFELIFAEELIGARFTDRHLREACSQANVKIRTSHCLRHTYATELAGLSNSNPRLARMVLD